ncbi:conserved hypothetical protein [delta proteobacterium NaphS2]|nr:conserved hypothetical protein [delta proteobacterium NaphS2]
MRGTGWKNWKRFKNGETLVLKDREEKIKQGKDEFIDWEQAKKDIQDSIS